MKTLKKIVRSETAPADTDVLWLNTTDGVLYAFDGREGWKGTSEDIPEGLAQESTSQEILGKINTLTALDSDIAGGKQAVAAAVTAKGVQTASTDSLAQMAENIGDIQHTVIDGGDMYAAQLTGDGSLWDLYSVLAQMKSQWLGAGHYAALIVCEYYRDYASLWLHGADAYYTCDGDFYDTSSPLHVWHDGDNGKMNRWVCFLFATDGARLGIASTAASPRSMYIGGHIGTIEYYVPGRLTELVCGVEDTDILDNFAANGCTQEFSSSCVIRNTKKYSGLFKCGAALHTILCDLDENLTYSSNVFCSTSSYLCSIRGIKNVTGRGNVRLLDVSAEIIEMPDLVRIITGYQPMQLNGYAKILDMRSLKEATCNYGILKESKAYTVNLIDVIVGELDHSFIINHWTATNVLAAATLKAQLIENIKNHILSNISDRTGDTQLVFTVETSMYNAISGENITWNGETMTLADAFLTKNWLLAGAD